ncbi:MAG: long-chain-fatty-acid--CoA ligase [Chloroflexi bacterium]|nr:long-chain-fatty-acid--CoA ligase [Chloroflexota bacterium]
MRLHDFVDYHAREHPDAEFAVLGDRKLTYGDANEQINRLANAFSSTGIQKGDRVAVLSKNSIDYVILYYAASKAGVVPVPLNYRLTPPEWTHIINDSQARMLIASADYVQSVDTTRSELRDVGHFVSIGGPDTPGWTDYRGWVGGQPATPTRQSITPDDDVVQMYTSGTTGHPKGAVLTHGSLTANLGQCSPALDFRPGERVLIVAPLYHVAAAFIAFSANHKGSSLYVYEDFDPVEVVRAMDQEKIRWALLVPAMIQACLVAVPEVAQRSYADLRGIVYGASPIAEETLRRAAGAFKCEFVQAFGQTELSSVATVLSPDDHRRALVGKPELLLSAGRPVLGTDLRIVDEDDNPVANGTMGEIVVRGPQMMKGYWNLPDETAEAMRGGWMHTGDAGTLDDEGYVYVQDRVKDMIVSGGENVYPRMVEDVLFKHPAIADAAVIGVPDDQWGETVKAVVLLREGASATEDEIIEFCRGRMGGFQRPRSVDFVASLPRNPSGKILKRELREPYWEGRGRRVAGA